MGRRRRGGSSIPTPSVAPSAFRRKLNEALGNRYSVSREAQMEYQVPLSTGYLSTTPEPMAVYCFARKVLPAQGGSDIDDMLYMLDTTDMAWLLANIFTSNQLLYNNAIMYKNFFTVRAKASYSLRNQTNGPTRVEILKFRVRKDIYRETDSNHLSYNNPLNAAGMYLRRTNDATAGDFADARNIGLHTNRAKLEQIPVIKRFFKCKKKTKTLSPGQVIHHSVSYKRTLNLGDLIGTTKIGQTASEGKQLYLAGTQFVIYKLLSDTADYSGTSGEYANVLDNFSTRTIPAGLMSYSVKYDILVPTSSQETSHYRLDAWGMDISADATSVKNMLDSDFKEELVAVSV